MVDAKARQETPPTLLESALYFQRTPTILLLIVLPLVSWAWIVVMARDMYGRMTGASAWMMTAAWDAPHLGLLWAMWAVMMTAMMVPSATPMLLLYGSAARHAATRPSAASRQIYAFAAGYVVMWALFSLGATALQRTLAYLLVVSSMMEVTRPVGALLLLIAGAYQLTPFKQACLRTCQSPWGFLMSHWRAGLSGAFRMGLQHGAICVGCCWALMLLLFAGGVMNLAVIATLTVLVAFEKLSGFGTQGARLSGILLIVVALWMFVR